MGICKVLTYEFHYEYIKNIHGKNSRLLLADTDSLMYQIKGEDIYKILAKIKKCLILVIIQPIPNIMMIQTNEGLVK